MDIFTLEIEKGSFDMSIHLLDKKNRHLVLQDYDDEQITTFEIFPK